jgi:DNA-binding transcriptional LysR family regulator
MMVAMRIRDLSWLIALRDHEHMTSAASALRIPQPTLSRALARVEAELGAVLFERVPAGVRPTPIGELVVAAAVEITARYDRLVTDVGNILDPDTGIVRLAFIDSTAVSLVPRLLRRFHELAPGVQVVLSQEPGHEIIDDLMGSRADLAVTSVRPVGDYGWLPLYEERLVLIVPDGHRLAAAASVRPADLAHEQFVTTPRGFGYRSLTDGILAAEGVVPRVSFESQDLATIEGLVGAGLGLAIVPEAFAGLSGTTAVALASDDARRAVAMTWRTDRELSQPAIRFRDMVVAEFGM